ncbi:MAG: hypothetical protein GF353_27850 [Candidatus Lokiarchaeota archaeon]|nr:hypothetical protein [Candidatus Lokiarchaeota archaeon]
MTEDEIQKLEEINEIDQILEYIAPFYPDLKVKKKTIVEIEKALYNTYIKILGKILIYSPENMRLFLRAFLLKYEIMNIKQIISGSIVGLSLSERRKNVNFLVEEYLENTEFIRQLLEIYSLDEIVYFMRDTRYNKVVREGILYFKNNNEIFVLDAFLDRLYYRNLVNIKQKLNKKEFKMISLFIDYQTEIYNLNTLYRGSKNGIEEKLLRQFLVENYLFFTNDDFEFLLTHRSEAEFLSRVEQKLNEVEDMKNVYLSKGIDRKDLIRSLEKLYQNLYFFRFKEKIDDIEFMTIYRILEVIIKKNGEIKFEILPKVVDILHSHYSKLEDYIKK